MNDDYQTAMMNGGKLEVFHSTPYDGREGFLSDLVKDGPDTLHSGDAEYIRQAAENEGFALPENWQARP